MTNGKNKKNIVQDVVPPRRSIRNVELPSRREHSSSDIIAPKKSPDLNEVIPPPIKSKEGSLNGRSVGIKINKEEKSIFQESEEKSSGNYAFEYEQPPKSSKKLLYSAIFVFVLALAFGISSFFKSAVIRVTPKNETVTFNQNLTAKKDSNDGLAFQTVILSKDLEKSVEATSEQKVSKKATGTIVVYNNYSTQPQKLLINTRFQTSDGLIFRSVEAINIPGKKTVSGKTVAGSVEISVVADQTGEKYNIGLNDFTIPGFKGDPRYSQIYARSKTNMTGGFEGMQKVVSEDVLNQANSELESKVKDYLAKEISSQIPANFILYPDSISYSFAPLSQLNSSSTQGAVLRKKGTATAIIFDKGSLSRVIINKVLPDVADDVVKISNLESFIFSYTDNSTFDSNTSTSLDFVLKGDAKFEWVFDDNKLKSDLLGLPKDKALTVISTYKSIQEAWIETQPFWNKTIPTDSNKVTLVNTLAH